MTSTADTPLMRFDDCVLDVARRELTRDGDAVVVQPRVFDLLVYLVEHRDRAVNKDEIQDAVWPGMVVTETALTRAVMKARRAVGDDASRQGVIKTIHGHGYRFVAEVSLEARKDPPVAVEAPTHRAHDDAEPVSAAAPAMAATHQAIGTSWRRWGFTAALAIGALALIWVLVRPGGAVPEGTRIAVLPVTNDTGNEALNWARLGLMSLASGLLQNAGEVAIVPDAKVVALSGSFAAGTDLAQRLRRAYGATHIIAMRLERSGDLLRMTYTLETPDGDQTQGTMVGDESTELARGVVRSVVSGLTGHRRMRENVAAISDDPFVNEAHARGMSAKLDGRCGDARDLFKVAMDAEPALFAPRLGYAQCARILGDTEDAESVLNALIDVQRAADAPRPLAEALNTLGVLYNRSGRIEQAQTTLDEALAVATAVGDDDLAGKTLTNLAIVAEDQNRFDDARALVGRAMLAYEAAGRETPPGQLHSLLANIGMQEGELDEAEVHLARALDAYRLIGDRRREAMMINNTGFLRRLQGRLDEAESYHLRSLAIREEIGDRVGVGRIRGMLAIIYENRGQFDAARDSAAAALAIARETNDRLFEGTSLSQLADAERDLGDLEAAADHYREARAVFAGINDRMRTLQVDLRLARMELDAGDAASARAMTEAVLARSEAETLSIPQVEALELLGDIATHSGARDEAMESYDVAMKRVRELSWSAKETTLAIKLAETYLDVGDTGAAEPLVGYVSQQPDTFRGARLRARYAAVHGRRDEAVTHMKRAQDLAGARWSPADQEQLLSYQE